MPSGEEVSGPDDIAQQDPSDSVATPQFAVARTDAGELIITVSFKGDRFAGGRLPVSALPTLAKMESLFNAVASDVDLDLNNHARTSRHAKVQLVLTGDIDDGSARLTALVLPVLLAVSPVSRVEQDSTILEALRRTPIVSTQAAAGTELSFPTSRRTLESIRDLSQGVRPGETLVLTVGPVNEATLAVEPATEATFSSDTARSLGAQLDATADVSFFVTGTLRTLEDQGVDGSMTLVTGSGQFRVPASPEHRQAAAKMYADARSVIFAVSGRGAVDGAGRMRHVTHLSELTAVDRMFNMTRRLDELRALAADAENAGLAARIGRAETSLPTIVHRTGLAPALFLTEENEIEARWVFGTKVVNVTFGSDIEIYIFDRATEQIVLDQVLTDNAEVLPAWVIADAIVEHRGASNE